MEIICELGSNPAPRGWPLEDYVRAAALAGASHVKVQCFRAEHFPEWARAEKRKVEFPRERLGEFARLAHAYGMAAGASVFDAEVVTLCAQELDFLKLAAREQDNSGLSLAVQRTGKKFYRSVSRFEPLSDYWYVPNGLTLWAIQKYPVGMLEALFNLARWALFCRLRGLPFGWSSHTTGLLDCVIAARIGASVIEKHFALTMNDPEAGHSLNSSKFSEMVKAIKG